MVRAIINWVYFFKNMFGDVIKEPMTGCIQKVCWVQFAQLLKCCQFCFHLYTLTDSSCISTHYAAGVLGKNNTSSILWTRIKSNHCYFKVVRLAMLAVL